MQISCDVQVATDSVTLHAKEQMAALQAELIKQKATAAAHIEETRGADTAKLVELGYGLRRDPSLEVPEKLLTGCLFDLYLEVCAGYRQLVSNMTADTRDDPELESTLTSIIKDFEDCGDGKNIWPRLRGRSCSGHWCTCSCWYGSRP